jgi:peptidoglycan/xylan/chitin deacetylase (PgdA/CDA1 family)
MTRDELIKLAETGLFEIGAHTVTHPNMSAQSIGIQRAELHDSKTWLEEILGKPVMSFAYPYGGPQHYTEATMEAVRNAGFRHACTTAARHVENTDAPLELPRFNITDMNGEEFERLLFLY